MPRSQILVTASVFFFIDDTATTEIYTLSLHDALPIRPALERSSVAAVLNPNLLAPLREQGRSEEHTSELQSLAYLVCRLLLEKKNAAASALGSFYPPSRTAGFAFAHQHAHPPRSLRRV